MSCSTGRILIRADATPEIGTGHVTRCLALAQAWRNSGGNVIFAMAAWVPAIAARVESEGFQVVSIQTTVGSLADARCTVESAHVHGAEWVVADGYSFDGNYQRLIQAAGLKVLLVDDNGQADRVFADLVLNQNLHARTGLYPQLDSKTQLLLGPSFALLRDEYYPWRDWQRKTSASANRVLITMGGSDPHNLCLRAIQAVKLLSIRGLQTKVATTANNLHLASLRAFAKGPVQLEVNGKMPELISWADIAVAATGTTCWEMCMLGLPAILIDAVDSQTLLAHELHRRGVALHVPFRDATDHRLAKEIESLIENPELRSSMSRRAAGLVDGWGAKRVVASILDYGIRLRDAQPADSHVERRTPQV